MNNLYYREMDIKKHLKDIERRATKLRVPMQEVCDTAKVHITTISSWRQGISDPFQKPNDLERAMTKLEKKYNG